MSNAKPMAAMHTISHWVGLRLARPFACVSMDQSYWGGEPRWRATRCLPGRWCSDWLSRGMGPGRKRTNQGCHRLVPLREWVHAIGGVTVWSKSIAGVQASDQEHENRDRHSRRGGD